jgi:hypothetical protein
MIFTSVWDIQKLRFTRPLGRHSAAMLALASICLFPAVALAQMFEPNELYRDQWQIDHDPWQSLPDPSGRVVKQICSTGEGILHVTEYTPVTDPQTGEDKVIAHPRQVVKVFADKDAVAHNKCSVEWVDGSIHGVGWMALEALEPVRYRPRAKTQDGN